LVLRSLAQQIGVTYNPEAQTDTAWTVEDGNVRIQMPKGAVAARLATLWEQSEGSPLGTTNGATITVPTHP
jgi:hypothetical protein